MIITNEEALRVKCEDVTLEEVNPLIKMLQDELDIANKLGRGGVGLAAPQIGIAKKIAIVRVSNLIINLINCNIEKGFDEAKFVQERCLSFPGRTEDTLRYQEVYITNNLMYPHSFVVTGLIAVICQHEIDHFNGKLFFDKIVNKSDIISKIKDKHGK
jgi:peptide deformylase